MKVIIVIDKMDSKEVQQQVLSGESGIYTLTGADLEDIGNVMRMQGNYIMEKDSMSKYVRTEQLSSLLTRMSVRMRKYGFADFMQKERVEGYTFNEVKQAVPLLDGDPDLLDRACELAFTAWETVLKKLGVGLPTSSFHA